MKAIRRFVAAAALCVPFVAAAQPSAAPGEAVRYDGHAVVRVDIRTPDDMQTMLGISPDVWTHTPRPGPVDFRIPPESRAALDASGLRYEVIIPDLQPLLDAENLRIRRHDPRDPDWFTEYKPLDAVYAYAAELAALRPDLASLHEIGRSLEDRPILALRISNDAARGVGRGCKPAFLLNSCQHAREWVTPMANMYLADALLRRYDSDESIRSLVDDIEWWIVPNANPDGYEYTWTRDRLWRKNRRDNGDGNFGVDNNRNWSFKWGLDLPGSSHGSDFTGSEVYWGAGPFSEPENRALRDLALSLPNLRAHLDVHSYGQYILQPWQWTEDLPPDHALYDSLGQRMAELIHAVHDKTYTHGTCYSTLYPVAGGATDWFYAERGAVSLTYELRGSPGGFKLPADQIVPNAEEILPATLHMAALTRDLYPFRADWDGNCTYNVRDFTAFQNDFVHADPAADFNADGVLDINDFIAFQAQWRQRR